MRKRILTNEVLNLFRESFDYNPETGHLRWKTKAATHLNAGYIAGCHHTNGHMEVKLHNVSYMVHHIVWALVHGKFPDKTLTHLNGNKRDNRLSNLVEAGFGPKETHVPD